jgi:Flp pilus assembly protein TadD
MSPHRARAEALMEQGRWELALPELVKALADEPEAGEIHLAIARCHYFRDKETEALPALDQAQRLLPDDARVHLLRGLCLLAIGRRAEARAALEEARRLEPDWADVHGAIAQWHLGGQDWQAALDSAERGLALDPEHSQCSNLRALALTRLGRADEAVSTAEAELNRDPDNGYTHAQRGWALVHQRRYKEAALAFREALRLEPGLEWARQGLIEALKARNPIYALFLHYFLFMERLGAKAWLFILGIWLAQRVVRELGEQMPAWAWAFDILFWLLVAFVVGTWIAVPLFNLTLFLHPIGRYALDRGERIQAWVCGGVLGGILVLVGATVAGVVDGWIWTIAAALFAIPLIFLADPGLPRWGRLTVAGLLVVMGGMAWRWAGLEIHAREQAAQVEQAYGGMDQREAAALLMEDMAATLRRQGATAAASAPSASAAVGTSAAQPPARRQALAASMAARRTAREAFNLLALTSFGGSLLCLFLSGRRRR